MPFYRWDTPKPALRMSSRDAASMLDAVRYARLFDPVGHAFHVVFAMAYMVLMPIATFPGAISFAALSVVSIIRLIFTWRALLPMLLPSTSLALLAWAVWHLLTMTWSNDPAQGLDEFGAYRAMLLVLLLWPVIESWPRLVLAFLAGVLVQNGIQAAQDVGVIEVVEVGGRIPGLMHPIHTATFSLASMCWCLAAIVHARGWWRWISVVLFVAAAYGLVVSGSRGPLIAAMIVLPLQLVATAWRWPRARRVVGVVAGIALVGTLVSWPFVGSVAQQRAATARDEVVAWRDDGVVWSSSGLRLALWSWADQIFESNPVIGVGAGGFRDAMTALPEYEAAVERGFQDAIENLRGYDAAIADGRPVEDLRGYPRAQRLGEHREAFIVRTHPHSVYLHVAACMGIVGLAVLVFAMASALVNATRAPHDAPWADGTIYVLGAWLIAGLFDAYHLSGQLFAVAMLAITLVMPHRPATDEGWASPSLERPEPPRERSTGRFLLCVLVTGVSMILAHAAFHLALHVLVLAK